jgi:ribosomal-protein-alanine N-acetyltransferase
MVTLRTDRLVLRPLQAEDAEAYAVMRYHPDVAKWLSLVGDTPGPIDRAHKAIEHFTHSWRERGYAPWGLFRDGRLIGQGGLNYLPIFGATEVLWALHPDHWGQGYATEMAQAALRLGFATLGLPLIFAITRPDNLASQAVMKRLGLTYRKDVVYKETDAVWFDIDRAAWKVANAS